MLYNKLKTFSGRPKARHIKSHRRKEMSYIAFEASGLLVNGVLMRRGFPNHFRTLMEGMARIWVGDCPFRRVTARKGFWGWRITVGEHCSRSSMGHCFRRALLEWDRNFSWKKLSRTAASEIFSGTRLGKLICQDHGGTAVGWVRMGRFGKPVLVRHWSTRVFLTLAQDTCPSKSNCSATLAAYSSSQ